jgi:hypothetical protein
MRRYDYTAYITKDEFIKYMGILEKFHNKISQLPNKVQYIGKLAEELVISLLNNAFDLDEDSTGRTFIEHWVYDANFGNNDYIIHSGNGGYIIKTVGGLWDLLTEKDGEVGYVDRLEARVSLLEDKVKGLEYALTTQLWDKPWYDKQLQDSPWEKLHSVQGCCNEDDEMDK